VFNLRIMSGSCFLRAIWRYVLQLEEGDLAVLY
jgi:hypothetical protein